MKVKAELDLDTFYDSDWEMCVESAIKAQLTSLVQAEVRKWFKDNEKKFQEALSKYGVRVMDPKILEIAVKNFLKDSLPLGSASVRPGKA